MTMASKPARFNSGPQKTSGFGLVQRRLSMGDLGPDGQILHIPPKGAPCHHARGQGLTRYPGLERIYARFQPFLGQIITKLARNRHVSAINSYLCFQRQNSDERSTCNTFAIIPQQGTAIPLFPPSTKALPTMSLPRNQATRVLCNNFLNIKDELLLASRSSYVSLSTTNMSFPLSTKTTAGFGAY